MTLYKFIFSKIIFQLMNALVWVFDMKLLFNHWEQRNSVDAKCQLLALRRAWVIDFQLMGCDGVDASSLLSN